MTILMISFMHGWFTIQHWSDTGLGISWCSISASQRTSPSWHQYPPGNLPWSWHPIDHQIAYFISAELDDHTLILWWWWWWYLGGWWGEIFSWRWQLARLSSFPLAQSARMVSFSVCGIFPLISSHWGVIYTRASPSSVYFRLIPAAGCAARPSRPSHLPLPWKHQQLIPC